jgi:hypothetical protein
MPCKEVTMVTVRCVSLHDLFCIFTFLIHTHTHTEGFFCFFFYIMGLVMLTIVTVDTRTVPST